MSKYSYYKSLKNHTFPDFIFNPLLLLLFFMNSLSLQNFSVVSATEGISHDVNDVKFYVYPWPNSELEISMGGVPDELVQKSIRSNENTILIIDGFLSNKTTSMNSYLTNLALESNPSKNVFVVDWGKLSGNGANLQASSSLIKTLMETYANVFANIRPVGGRIADFIHYLQVQFGISPEKVHIVGHSMGAHIAGETGRALKGKYGVQLGRISGLDPAGPLFSWGRTPGAEKLAKGAANFVDIYYTNRGKFGDAGVPSGDLNVFVNGATFQPGCGKPSDPKSAICSHSYSWKMYGRTFVEDLMGCPCIGLACLCTAHNEKAACRRPCKHQIPLGEKLPPGTSGSYRLIYDNPM